VSDIYSYRLGLDYFGKEKYSAAQKEFEKAIVEANNPNSELSINAEYFAALCAIELFHRDASLRLREFIISHPESPKVLLAKFKLGLFYYRKSQWKDVIAWFEQIDPLDLDREMRFERDFKLGYAYFQRKEYEMAATKFFELKDVNNPYAAPARYYFAHIAYMNKQLETAYSDFKKLEGDETFGKLIPYYLTQILHQQKKFDELLIYAPPLLDSVLEKRKPEMARLIGDAWYAKGEYAKALSLLEEHSQKSQSVNNDDRYQLAYCYFKTGDCEKAAPLFGRLLSLNNAMAQLAAYQLGECYRAKGEKTYARNAYQQAFALEFDAEIRRDAMFNAAVMGYEAGMDPYGKSAVAFEEFIKTYPESERVNDAYKYLTSIFLSSNNYEAALAAVERMRTKSPEVKSAYQLVAFNRGVELYQNREYAKSREYLLRSQKFPEDAALNARAHFWLGEAFFREKQVEEALKAYREFIYTPAAILTPHFYEANYNIAYCYFQQQNFTEAISWFRKFIYRIEEADSMRINDALLRTGDAYIVLKQYDYALDFYKQAAAMQSIDADYALFQQAVCLGVMRDYKQREQLLDQLTQSYPMSAYYEPALYELGRTRAIIGQTESAQTAYAKCIQEGDNALYIKKSLIASGLLYYNNGASDNALRIFNRVVSDYPNYNDTREALKVLKSIYIERGEVEKYSALVDQLGFANVTQSELDSAVFEAAELRYMESACDKAVTELEAYLEKFQPALFETRARAYLADCAYRSDLRDKSLIHYSILASDTAGEYAEVANLRMAEMMYENDPEKALGYFMVLEKRASNADNLRTAILGQMDCLYRLDKKEGNTPLANRLMDIVSADNYYIALSFLYLGIDAAAAKNNTSALEHYEKAAESTRSEVSAEARYRAALLHFESDSMDRAEELVFALVNQVPSYGDWIARGLLLLSDVYLATDKVLQAKSALQSVIDNYDKEPLRSDAKARLETLETQESQLQQKESAPNKNEIDLPLQLPNDHKDVIDYDEIDKLYEELLEEEDIPDDLQKTERQ
jgi:tetratricopeptide (TPR) repeat protein